MCESVVKALLSRFLLFPYFLFGQNSLPINPDGIRHDLSSIGIARWWKFPSTSGYGFLNPCETQG